MSDRTSKSTFVVGAVVALTLAALAGALVGRQYPLSSEPQVSPTEQNLPTNPNSAPTNPTSTVGVDYRKLENLLAQGKWKEADEETWNVMLQVAGREKNGWLDIDSIQKFSCTDLGSIDNLWVKYSKGRFGFSVQQRIWESVGGTLDANWETYQRFGDRIKWPVNNNSLNNERLTFSVEAPKGHLPVAATVAGLFQISTPAATRLTQEGNPPTVQLTLFVNQFSPSQSRPTPLTLVLEALPPQTAPNTPLTTPQSPNTTPQSPNRALYDPLRYNIFSHVETCKL
jgi:hypothetical protein